ncbi:MAG: LysR family transcriptional regulator [Pseudomonadota bacterium]
MRPKLDDLHLFCRIVETGSLRSAAQQVGTDPSSVSRRLSGLEDRLGVQLIARSRLQSTTTDAGRAYYDELKLILERMAELEDDVAGAAADPRGTLRVAAPIDLGMRFIGPWLHELSEQSPRLSVDLVVSDQFVDFEGQGLDAAIRVGALSDSALMSRRLGAMPMAIVGSPQYLSAHGAPTSPDDLSDHAFIYYSGLQAGAKLELTHKDGSTTRVETNGRFSVNNLGGVAQIVHLGGGLHAGPLWYFADDIQHGRLLHVLPNWSPPSYPVHMLYASGTYVPAKVRRFIDLAVLKMRNMKGVIP